MRYRLSKLSQRYCSASQSEHSIYMQVSLSMCLFVLMYVCMPVFLSVRMHEFTCLSIRLFDYGCVSKYSCLQAEQSADQSTTTSTTTSTTNNINHKQ